VSVLMERRPAIGLTATELAFAWFQRIIACYCLLFGVLYWVRLIGFYDGALWRFDLMPMHWQIAAVTLAVFYPFAASGLWMLASWGPVIWFICAAIEVVMYAGFPNLFGARTAIVWSHGVVALFYIGFRIAIFLQKRRQMRNG
jgi:hypothetical protein